MVGEHNIDRRTHGIEQDPVLLVLLGVQHVVAGGGGSRCGGLLLRGLAEPQPGPEATSPGEGGAWATPGGYLGGLGRVWGHIKKPWGRGGEGVSGTGGSRGCQEEPGWGGRRVSEEPGGCLGALSRGLEVTGVAPGSPGEG